jgi:hypothetical protein
VPRVPLVPTRRGGQAAAHLLALRLLVQRHRPSLTSRLPKRMRLRRHSSLRSLSVASVWVRW